MATVVLCNFSSHLRPAPRQLEGRASTCQHPGRRHPAGQHPPAPRTAGGHHHASGSAIRKNTSTQHGHPAPAPRQLLGPPAGGPQEARQGPCPHPPSHPPSALTAGPFQPQQEASRGPRGEALGAYQGHTPRSRDPKLENFPCCVRAVRDSGVWQGCGAWRWGVSQCRLSVLGFASPTRERSESTQGWAGVEGVVLHLCCLRVNLSQARPTAPTGSHPAGVA